MATERRPVARTSLAVSRLGVGGGSLSNKGGDDGVRAMLDHAWQSGLRYFDTAPLYAAGDSETRFGAALRHRPRSEFVLSTKVGRFIEDGREVYDYSAAGVERSIERSLARLGLDRIDIAFIHDATPALHGDAFPRQFAAAMAGAYPALARMRAAGTISAVGVAMADADVCVQFARAGDFDCFMLAGGYTLLRHGSLDTLLADCTRTGASVMVAAPFNTGILATGAVEDARFDYRPASPDIIDRAAKLDAICRSHGVPLAAASLQFPLAHPAIASVVTGHLTPAEVARNIELLGTPIPKAVWSDMKHNGLLPPHAPTL